jgi:hypothetical protein
MHCRFLARISFEASASHAFMQIATASSSSQEELQPAAGLLCTFAALISSRLFE